MKLTKLVLKKIIKDQILKEGLKDDYKQFQSFQKDPFLRKWNFWGYIDARDVGQACLLALESDLSRVE